MSIESVMPLNHLILCCPILLLPSIFPSIRVFSNESVLRIRWPLEFSNFRGKITQTFWSVRIYYTTVCCIMFLYSPHSYISVDSWWNWEGKSKLIFHPKVCSFVSLSIWILWEVPCQIVNRKKDTAKSCLTFAIPWTIACQFPMSVGFSRHEYGSRLPFPAPGELPNPGIEPRSPALQADDLLTELCRKL